MGAPGGAPRRLRVDAVDSDINHFMEPVRLLCPTGLHLMSAEFNIYFRGTEMADGIFDHDSALQGSH